MSVLTQAFSSKLLRGHYAEEEPLIPFNYEGSPQEKRRLISMVNKIASHSETGKAVLQKAAECGYSLSFGMQHGSYGFTDADKKKLVLNPCFKDGALLNTLVHESRHAGQFANGIETEFGKMTLRSELMVFRAIEADACAVAAVAMLEAKQNKISVKGALRTGASGTVQNLFLKNADTKTVLQAAFNDWYDDIHIKQSYEDSYIIQPMREAVKEKKEKKMPYDKVVTSAQVIDRICATPEGCYFVNKDALNNLRYLDISPATKAVADRFFEIREMRTGAKPDKSYADLPINRQLSALHGYFKGVSYEKAPKTFPLPFSRNRSR